MRRCYELADIAVQQGESPVGSVVVKDGVIIGEGYEKSRQLRDITKHAEVLAILDALAHCDSLKGTTLYTNVEPCILCSYAVRHYRISEVVFAKYSGELGGTNPAFNLLTSHQFTSWDAPPTVMVFQDEE